MTGIAAWSAEMFSQRLRNLPVDRWLDFINSTLRQLTAPFEVIAYRDGVEIHSSYQVTKNNRQRQIINCARVYVSMTIADGCGHTRYDVIVKICMVMVQHGMVKG